MPRPTTEKDKSQFLETLQRFGGSQGNQALRARLSWTEDRYWRIHGSLADAGLIIRGRGKGGSVSLVEEEQEEHPEAASAKQIAPIADSSGDQQIYERDLYLPAKDVIETTWVRERAFDDSIVEITASPGRRATGGTWTRPDIAVLATKAYPYLPSRTFEIISFEIKTADSINVSGVFEALSHSQFATQSYVLFCTSGKDFDNDFKDTSRIIGIAAKHGIGLIVANDISQYASWDERVRPIRNEPDPEQANLFISSSFSDSAKQRVVKWHK